jgi:hypothetical protein
MLAQAVVKTLPQNLKTAKNLYSATRAFSEANNLAAPTKEDADAVLAGWGRR